MMTTNRITNGLTVALVAVMAMVFTTAPANADVLTPTAATVDRVNYGSAAAMINGSGMNENPVTPSSIAIGTYSVMWLVNSAPPSWAIFDLGAEYDLTQAYIWNGHYYVDYGVETMNILVSAVSDTGPWTQVGGTVTMAAGQVNTAQVKPLVANGVRYIKFDVLTGQPSQARHGLAEVRFEGGPAGSGSVDPIVTLSALTVSENVAVGTVVGVLGTANTDSWTTPISYSFNGGVDDGSFDIADGTNLVTDEVFDRETKSSYTIDVRATDNGGGNTTNKEIFVTIGDVAETDGMFARGEVQTGTTLVGTLEATVGGATYAVNAGEHYGTWFEIQNTDELHLKTEPEAGQVGDEYLVEVTASGPVTDSILIKVTVVNTTPAATVITIR